MVGKESRVEYLPIEIQGFWRATRYDEIGMSHQARAVFVYGTLTDEDRIAMLLDDYSVRDRAVLEGLHRVEGTYPTLAPGGRVEGRIIRTPELDRLDQYEGVDRGLYVRIQVPHDDGMPVFVYVGDPDALDVSVSWPAGRSVEAAVQTYVETHHVRVRPLSDNR